MSVKAKNKKQQKKRRKNEQTNLLTYLMIFCPFFTGLAENSWLFGVSLILLGTLIVRTREKGIIRIGKGIIPFSGLVILLCGMITVFVGVSHGDSVIGLMRLISIGLYGLVLLQYETEERREAFRIVPDVGVLMTIISAVLYVIPEFRGQFSNGAGRLAGFFQYSNVYALFLLLGLVIYTMEEIDDKADWKAYIYPLILLGGILWSGSRITFGLTILMMIYLTARKREVRIPYLIILGMGILFAVTLACIIKETDTFARFMTTFTHTSTLVGRLLYVGDGLKMVLRHPLGMGYYGYYLMQPYEQTGVYVVRFAHNEWLQMALDYGVIAGVAFVVFMVEGLRIAKGTERLVIVLIALHSFLDFDLQFTVIVWILLLSVDWDREKIIEVRVKGLNAGLIMGTLSTIFLWLSAADFLRGLGAYEMSTVFYPWAVVTEEYAMIGTEDVEQMEKHADHILSEFEYDGVAYEVKALIEKERGNYLNMLENQRKSVLYRKYDMEQYERYAIMLHEASDYFELYDQDENVEICNAYLEELPLLLHNVERTTSPLSYHTVDAPQFILPDTE